MIYVVRHGETDWNLQEKMQGQTDTPLNDTGREQAKAAAAEVAKNNIHHIFSSDLLRAKETAEIINKELGLEIIFDKRIREYSFGDLEGRNRKDITPQEWKEFNIDARQFNAETIQEIYSRVKSFLDEIESKNLGNVLLVTHGGTTKMLLYCTNHNTLNETEFMQNYMQKENIGNSSLIKLSGCQGDVAFDTDLCQMLRPRDTHSSMKSRRRRVRLGLRSLRRAFASICRMRSRVTWNSRPTSSSVLGLASSIP